jgi:hypothetical protein
MRTLISAALAGSLAAAGLATPATAGHHPAPPPVYHPYPNVAGAIAAGAFLGYAFGALLAPRPVYVYPGPYAYPPPPPPPPVPIVYPPGFYPPLTPHAQWCFNTYGAAYNPATDVWVDAWGTPRRCIAPW